MDRLGDSGVRQFMFLVSAPFIKRPDIACKDFFDKFLAFPFWARAGGLRAFANARAIRPHD
jgi:hypothetical protein